MVQGADCDLCVVYSLAIGMPLLQHTARVSLTDPVPVLQKYVVSCADVDMADTRHQCVFLRCNTEQYVMQAADVAYRAFGMPPKPYMPHCSLLYSDISSEERCVRV